MVQSQAGKVEGSWFYNSTAGQGQREMCIHVPVYPCTPPHPLPLPAIAPALAHRARGQLLPVSGQIARSQPRSSRSGYDPIGGLCRQRPTRHGLRLLGVSILPPPQVAEQQIGVHSGRLTHHSLASFLPDSHQVDQNICIPSRNPIATNATPMSGGSEGVNHLPVQL